MLTRGIVLLGKVLVFTEDGFSQLAGNYTFTYDKSTNIISLNLMPEGGTATEAYQVKYSDVKATNAGKIAHSIKVNATIEKKKFDLSMTYKNIDWNGNVKIDHSIPSNYKRMSARDLLSMFSN